MGLLAPITCNADRQKVQVFCREQEDVAVIWGNSSKSNKTQPQTAPGLFIMTGNGRVGPRRTIRPKGPAGRRNITTDEKAARGGKKASRKKNHREMAKRTKKKKRNKTALLMLVGSKYILDLYNALSAKGTKLLLCDFSLQNSKLSHRAKPSLYLPRKQPRRILQSYHCPGWNKVDWRLEKRMHMLMKLSTTVL